MKLFIPPRAIYVGIALFCAASVAFALYMQNYEFVIPCPLCIFQRIGIMACGGLALLAAAIPLPRVPWVWPSLISVAALCGAGVSIRHIQIQQSLASEHPQSCGAGLDYMLQNDTFPHVVASVLAGHGDCTVIDWQLGPLTLPMLALSGFAVILMAVGYIGIRQHKLAIAPQKVYSESRISG